MNPILDDNFDINIDIKEKIPRPLNIFTRIQVLFGSIESQVGFAFFWFGIIIILMAINKTELYYWFIDGDWVETIGVVESTEITDTEVNNQYYYTFNFKYTVDGEELSGSSQGLKEVAEKGQSVPVEYLASSINDARIIGTSVKYISSSSMATLFLIFFLPWFLALIIELTRNVRALRLLRIGTWVIGREVGREETKSEEGNISYKIKFSFKTATGSYTTICRTSNLKLIRGGSQKILYNPKKPSRNLVYNEMTILPKIDESGELIQSSAFALLYLLIPIIPIIGIAVQIIYLKY